MKFWISNPSGGSGSYHFSVLCLCLRRAKLLHCVLCDVGHFIVTQLVGFVGFFCVSNSQICPQLSLCNRFLIKSIFLGLFAALIHDFL